MKRRWIVRAATLALLGVLAAAPALAGEAEYVFGGGGPGFGLFMPELDEINKVLIDAGYAPLVGDVFFIGGSGRGGTIPGMTYGGGGWGAWITSRNGSLHAEYGLGLGGFDLGYAVGGSERSVLTVGALMGAVPVA